MMSGKALAQAIMRLLEEEQAADQLPGLISELEHLVGQKQLVVTSALELSEEEKAQLNVKLGATAQFVVQPDILGGLIIDRGDMRQDLSLRHQLDGLTAETRSQHANS